MTVQQLLSWTAYAHDRHDSSYNDVADKHTICLKQALLDSEPKIETHGYGTSEGERELAIVLIHTCNYNEVCEMENQAYNLCKEPVNIPTNVSMGIPAPEPFYISATEAIRQAEAVAERGEILYDRPTSIAGIPPAYPAPSMPPIVPYTMGEVTTFESPLRALSVEESRAVLTEAYNSLNPPPVMSTAEMGAYMQEVLNGPVAEGCTIPMDLRTSA